MQAEARGMAMFDAIEHANLLRPGRTEADVDRDIFQLARDRFGVTQHWHKRVVRAGANTLCTFHDKTEVATIADDDNRLAAIHRLLRGHLLLFCYVSGMSVIIPKPLAIFLFALATSTTTTIAANTSTVETCGLIVTERWPRSTLADPHLMADIRHRAFQSIGTLLDAAYRNGGYAANPTSFPVHDTDFRDDHIVFVFRTQCARARMFLSELLLAFKQRIPSGEGSVWPDLVVGDRPATNAEIRCGVAATEQTCPAY